MEYRGFWDIVEDGTKNAKDIERFRHLERKIKP